LPVGELGDTNLGVTNPVVSKRLKKIANLICIFGKCLMVLLSISVVAGAGLRYGLDTGFVKLQDFIRYTFGLLVLISILIAFIQNAHVKVNIPSFFGRFLKSTFFRIISATPFFAVALISLPGVYFSWSLFEGSTEPNGLGGLFLVKTALPLSFIAIGLWLVVESLGDERDR